MITAKKRFGQNFLIDKHIINQILAVFKPEPTDNVVEIGAGQGALTLPLLKILAHLDIIELDQDMIAILHKKLGLYQDHYSLHPQDALQFDFKDLIKLKTNTQTKQLRMIGNLPYNISTPLLFHLLSYSPLIQDMYFMLQQEVVDRICAKPDSKPYGRLSVMIQAYCQTHALFTVAPECFRPIPKVNSGFIQLIPYQNSPFEIQSHGQFATIVKTAFSQRRKTIKNNLKSCFTAQQFIELDIDPQARAENLTVAQFVILSNHFNATL